MASPADPRAVTTTTTRFRFARAYGVTLRVLAGYLWLRLIRPVIGSAAYEARLIDRHRSAARRVERAIRSLGGLFIKVGQLISILTNFLPEEFRRELEGLQDQLPPRPVEQIRARLQSEFGRPAEELFSQFDAVPLASASLAQVHAATLHDGRRVAVKVQHADIDVIVPLDLRIIRRILGIVQTFTRVRGLESYHAEISEMIAEELDFTMEAAHIEEIAANFADEPAIGFPQVIRELSTRRVLTTELVIGTKVTNIGALDAQGIDRRALAERILTAYCRMIFTDGVYHADPHPGNILVRPDGGVVFLDFGAVGALSQEMKAGIPAFLEGVLRRDPARITDALRRMGFVARSSDSGDVAERVIEYFQQRFLDQVTIDSWSLSNVQVDMRTKLETMADLRKLDISFRELTSVFQVPKDWVLLERTLLLLLGLCTHLDPTLNPMRTIRPYLEEYVLGRDRDWMGMVRTSLKEMAMAALVIPDQLNRLLVRANRGEVELRTPDVKEAAELVYRAAHQVVLGILATGTGLLAFLAYERGDARIVTWAGGASTLLLVVLAISALRWRRR